MTQSRLNFPSILFGPWPGGVNYSQPSEFIRPEELFCMQNTVFDFEASVKSRGGITKHNSSALNSGATVTGARHVGWTPTTDTLVAVSGDQFLEDAAKNGTFVDRTGAGVTITAGDENIHSMTFGDGRLMLCNGVDTTPYAQVARLGNLAAQDVDSRFTKPKFVAYWDNRAWWGYLTVSGVLTQWRVWRSDVEDVTTYGATNFNNVLSGQIEITGMKPWSDLLAVHFKSDDQEGIAAILPSSLSTIPYVVRVLGEKGTIAHNSIQNIPGGKQIFLREDGVYTFRRSDMTYQKISGNLDGPRYWDKVRKDKLFLSHSVLYDKLNQYRLTLPFGSTQDTPNHTIIYDYLEDRWMGPELNFTAGVSFIMDRDLFVGDYDGFIRQHDTANKNDDSSAVDSLFLTGAQKPVDSIQKFRWLAAQHYFDALGNWQVAVQQLGPEVTPFLSQFTVGDDFDAIETAFTIGVSKIAGAGIADSEFTQLTGYDSHLQFFYRNANANEPFRIRRAEAWFKPRKDA